MFDCARVAAWIAPDDKLWEWFDKRDALMVGLASERPAVPRVSSEVLYCPEIGAAIHGWLMQRLLHPERSEGPAPPAFDAR